MGLGPGPGSQAGGVDEEYRYDALGRRVMTRSRSTALSRSTARSRSTALPCIGPECSSYIERVAWDGNQVILEVRGRGKQGATPSDR